MNNGVDGRMVGKNSLNQGRNIHRKCKYIYRTSTLDRGFFVPFLARILLNKLTSAVYLSFSCTVFYILNTKIKKNIKIIV